MSAQDIQTDHVPDPIRRIPAPVRDSFTPEQVSAVSSAVGSSGRHPVDLRLTLPLPGLYAIALVAVLMMGSVLEF